MAFSRKRIKGSGVKGVMGMQGKIAGVPAQGFLRVTLKRQIKHSRFMDGQMSSVFWWLNLVR